MSTSGSIDYSLTARGVIDFALKKLRVMDMADEAAPATEAAQAQRELNLMLKGWQKYENLWRLTEGSVTLVADTYSYALSPVPHRVVSARYRSSSSIDLPMLELTRDEYYDMPNKSSTGIPTQYYVDYQRGTVTMLLWQALSSVTTETIQYTYQRKFEDVDSLDNDLDINADWLDVVGYNLAFRLGPDFGRCGSESFAKIEEQAVFLLEQMQDDDREDFIRFVPSYAEVG